MYLYVKLYALCVAINQLSTPISLTKVCFINQPKNGISHKNGIFVLLFQLKKKLFPLIECIAETTLSREATVCNVKYEHGRFPLPSHVVNLFFTTKEV